MTRRDKGDGYLARRPRQDGRWMASYVGSDGTKHYLYARTKAGAREALKAAIGDRDAGLWVAGPSQTVATFLEAWMQQAALRPRSRQRYAGVIKHHIAPALGPIELRKLNPQHIAALYADLAGRGLSAHNVHAVLSGSLRQAVTWNLIARNPAAAVRTPRIARRDIAFLDPTQARQLVTAVAGDPLEALYLVAIFTGMRLGELLGLQWRDVDVDGRRLLVRHALSREDGAWVLAEPKTAASRRTIELGATPAAALRTHHRREAERLLALGHRIDPDTLVFSDRWGDPLNPWHLTERSFKPLLRRVGLPVIRFHDLRHTFASLMLSDGVPLHVVSRMLGHSRPSVTLNTYAHLLPGDESAAVQRLERKLGGAG